MNSIFLHFSKIVFHNMCALAATALVSTLHIFAPRLGPQVTTIVSALFSPLFGVILIAVFLERWRAIVYLAPSAFIGYFISSQSISDQVPFLVEFCILYATPCAVLCGIHTASNAFKESRSTTTFPSWSKFLTFALLTSVLQSLMITTLFTKTGFLLSTRPSASVFNIIGDITGLFLVLKSLTAGLHVYEYRMRTKVIPSNIT